MSQLALAIDILIQALKLGACALTGSVALLSGALESVVNVIAAITVIIAIRIAARPADANHPFWHSKVEYLSAVIEGILIALASILIFQQAWLKFRQPGEVESFGIAAVLVLVATAFNVFLAVASV